MSENAERGSKNKPVYEIRIGCIKAVIWKNRVVDSGIMYNVVPVRIYRDDKGDWHDTHSLRRDDLLTARKVLDIAHSWICEAERTTDHQDR